MNRSVSGFLFIVITVFALGCSTPSSLVQSAPGVAQSYTPDSIYRLMKKVADWQIDSIQKNGWRQPELEWTNATFYAGLLAAAQLANDEKYYQFLRQQVGDKFGWKLYQNKLRYHADYYCVGQLYCRMYELYREPQMIADLQLLADTLLARPHTESLVWNEWDIGLREWAWCDALFMGPPSIAMLSGVTGKTVYMDLVDTLWWKTTDYLYDPEENLYFRDSRFFTIKEKNGKKKFWSRGNGWVMGGLVRVLENMPENYPQRQKWVQLYKSMSAKIASLQQDDGSWHASLLDPGSYPTKESSGTGFYCYALAWGINQGILDAKSYAPVIWKAWNALATCVHPGGKLGYVQPQGGAPDAVAADQTEMYGVGAFLLAGGEVVKMALQLPNYRPDHIVHNKTAETKKLRELLQAIPAGEKLYQRYRNILSGRQLDLNSEVALGTTLYLKGETK